MSAQYLFPFRKEKQPPPSQDPVTPREDKAENRQEVRAAAPGCSLPCSRHCAPSTRWAWPLWDREDFDGANSPKVAHQSVPIQKFGLGKRLFKNKTSCWQEGWERPEKLNFYPATRGGKSMDLPEEVRGWLWGVGYRLTESSAFCKERAQAGGRGVRSGCEAAEGRKRWSNLMCKDFLGCAWSSRLTTTGVSNM